MKKIFFILIAFSIVNCAPKNIKGSGKSTSKGSVKNGTLENGRRFPKKGDNFKYFSKWTYFINSRAWVHSKVLELTLEAYKECKKTMPDRKFMIMECSNKKGGEMWPHKTHQNGTSIDFATPLTKNNKPFHGDQWKGLFHYGLGFDESGCRKGNKKVSIDFETMAKHILELEKAARKRDMFIKKVLLKINLKDEFYKTKSGKIVKEKGIYFAKYLPKVIDNMHDDHYHIDFSFLK